MSTDTIAPLVEQRTGLLTEIRDLAAKAETDGNRAFTPDEQATITDRMTKARDLQTQITSARTAKAFTDEVADFLSDAGEAADLNDDALLGARVGLKGRQVKRLGEYFTGSKSFKAFRERYPNDLPTGTKVEGLIDPIRLESPSGKALGLKALIGTDPAGDGSGAGTLWDPQRLPTVPGSWPRLRMRDVITIGETSSDSVIFARILRAIAGGSTNNAAGVPEAVTTAAVGSGDPAVTTAQAGVKPESAILFEKVTAPVVTVAHWIPATKKSLSDAGQLRTLIDNFLRAGLAQEVERQIIEGDSAGAEEFDGILNTDGIQAQAFDTNILVSIRKAITKVSQFGNASAVLMSPATAERIDLLQISTGQFLGSGPFGPAIPTIWRRPIIEVPSLDDDTVLVGDFSTAVLWDREDVSISVSDSHLDFFTRNLVAILAEARAAFGVLDPALICSVDVDGADVIVPAP
jgi:hypothetical protein